jgi:hypothetical protein
MDFAHKQSHFSQGCSSLLLGGLAASLIPLGFAQQTSSRSDEFKGTDGTTIHRFGPGHLATHLSSIIIIITIIMLNILINNDTTNTQ